MLISNKNSVVLFICILFIVPLQSYSQTAEQHYFEWAQLPFPKAEYQKRRDNMLTTLKASGGGVLLCPSKDGLSDGETFRQLDDFNYFTGLELPNSLLVIDADQNEVILFVPNRDSRFEVASRKNDFPGRPLGDDPRLKSESGILNIQSPDRIDGYLKEKILKKQVIKINSTSPDNISILQTTYTSAWSPELSLIFHLQKTFPNVGIQNAYHDVGNSRVIKSPLEIAALRTAAEITAQGIKVAVKYIKPGVDERTLEAEMEAEFKRQGSPRIPFASIIKSGPNSLWPWRILAAHYERRNRKMEAGELVIFDVGCEYKNYVSDMGRTFPVSGKFTDEQKQILKMETAVSDAIIAAIKPGITFSDLKRVADAAIPENEKKYMQVGLFFGHHLGLSTGDPNDSEAKLAAGMVFTVEPWYYNHDKNISVFTEDEVLVTESGVEVLTKSLPRTPEALENLMKGK